MGYITPEVAHERLIGDNGSPPSTEELKTFVDKILAPAKGRPIGSKNISEEARAILGVDGLLLGITKAAEVHDTTIGQVFGATRGQSTASAAHTPPRPDRLARVKTGLQQVGEKAASVALRAVDEITDDKLRDTNAVGLSAVADRLASIAHKAVQAVGGQSAGIIILAGDRREIESYQTIDVPATPVDEDDD